MRPHFGRYEPATRAEATAAAAAMDGAGQSEPREQPTPAIAAATASPPSAVTQQQTPDAPTAVVPSDLPPPSAPSTTASATAAANATATTVGSTAVNNVVAEGKTQPADTPAARPLSPVSLQQTMMLSTLAEQRKPANVANQQDHGQLRWTDPKTVQVNGSHAQPGNLRSPGTGSVGSSPQLPLPPPAHYPQHPHPHPHPHPQQQHLQPQHSPVQISTPAAPTSASPAPVHSPHGAPHPQSQPQPQPQPQPPLLPRLNAHQYPSPHLHTLPHPHTLQHQQPTAPPSQIPHQHQQQQHQNHHQQQQQQQEQHPQHQHQQHHHQYHQPQPPPPPPPPQQQQPPSTPVTPATPLPHLHQLHPSHASQLHSYSQPQPQPQPQVLRSQLHHPHASLSKPVIMDPPGARKPSQSQQQRGAGAGAIGFPSPTQDYAIINPKFVDDCTRMNFAIQQSVPEAVRRIVRDHWEKCLLGSEFHQAFILNASIHHALPTITQRAVRDFGSKMVTESKHELMAHFTTEALDEVADLIISKASDSFLDKCLEKRLLTIEAKPLVKALAKAERLGYDPGDVIQDDQHERVIPQEAYPGATAVTNGHQGPPPNQPPPTYPQMGRSQLQCMKCFRTFMHTTAFDHHTRYDVCSQMPPTANGFEHSCPHCGQGFTITDELHGHLDNRICGNFSQPQTLSRGPGRPPKAATTPQAIPAAAIPSASQSPPVNGVARAPLQSTPAHPSMARAAAATPGSASSGNVVDPYGHLSEHQMQLMNDELHAAEEKYAPRFAEANLIPDENARKTKLEGLRNSFGTKQSMIRKKYGVRLRERRTKAEIMAERERLGLKKAEKEREKAMASVGVQMYSSSPSTNVESISRPTAGSGWTAANTPRANATWEEHDTKRRRMNDAGGYQTPYKSLADDTPTRKTLTVAEIGGELPGSNVTASKHDPTLPSAPQTTTKVYEESGARVEVIEPSNASKPTDDRTTTGTVSGSATPVGSDLDANGHNDRPSTEVRASREKRPVAIDDDSSDDDDEDIPSTLPTHVRKSLTSGSTSLLQTP